MDHVAVYPSSKDCWKTSMYPTAFDKHPVEALASVALG